MRPDTIIVRLGELTLKGKNRNRFEKAVLDRINEQLMAYPNLSIKHEFGRLYIALHDIPAAEITAKLERVFGLTSFSPAKRVEMDLTLIQETALAWMNSLPVKPASFRVSAKRANKAFPHDSMQIGRMVGGYVLNAIEGLTVDVHRPDVELRVDIRQEDAYVFTEVIPGTGGYPVGSNGKAMLLLSGGIDSPVAGWLSMRRGLEIEAVHFHSYPYTSERAKQKVLDLAKALSEYSGSIKVHLVSFTDIQTRLHQDGDEKLLVTLMKRAMLRIAERIAEKRGANGLITGESLGQVASQTLASLHAIGSVAELPVLRPLVMMDKTEIIQIAEKIGTFRISIQPYEDCCTLFLPKSPSTKPNLRVLEKLEKQMDWLEDALDEAVRGSELVNVQWGASQEFDTYF